MSGPEYEQMKWIGIKVEEDIVLVDQRQGNGMLGHRPEKTIKELASIKESGIL